MAEAIVSIVVKTIGNLLIEEGKFFDGVKDQAEELQAELKRMQWFLRDADAKNIEEDRIRQWVLEVQDIAYDAEDLLEGYAFRVGSGKVGSLLKVLKGCVCFLKECYLRRELGSEIKALNSKILNLKSSFQAYGVRSIMEKEGSSSRQPLLRRTYSFEEDDFVGLENDVDMLVQHLVCEDEHASYRVVSISGMGGLGKTTLANKVYNHPNVKRYFAESAWICVSQQWQAKDILQKIMSKLEPGKREMIERQWREDELIRQLFNVLLQRKCLIVLDDIWTTDAWDGIKQAFPTTKNGSKILLTTRNREVAFHIDPNGFHHQPRLLSQDESWELIRRKALQGRYDEGCANMELYEMEDLGKKMVERCAGLPLALIVLGGILSRKNSLSEWETVHQNIKTYLWKGRSIGQDKGEVQKILALSYYDLPYQLKPCFLYLSSFLEDTNIEAETLYQLWIAEGMVSVDNRVAEESMMELAERYLGELGQRGMVELQTSELPGITRYKSCRLHDLMRDLCLREAEESSFLKTVEFSSTGVDIDPFASPSAVSISKLRRLVVNLESKDICQCISVRKEITKHLRMLQFVVQGSSMLESFFAEHLTKRMKTQFNNFQMLHVLAIEGLRPQFNSRNLSRWKRPGLLAKHLRCWKLPKSIGKLIHLRYLSLKDSYFVVLPSSLGNLKHLQTLNLHARFLWRLPDVLWKMAGLTYLYLPRCMTFQRSKVRLDGLNKLEILKDFHDEYYHTTDLLKLNNLRELVVARCGDLENLALIANYAESSSRLQQVTIRSSYCDFVSSKEKGLKILEQLLHGRNIHQLSTQGRIWKIPECGANVSSSSVVVLNMDLFHLERDDHEDVVGGMLGKLPRLRILKIFGFKGKEMFFHGAGFPQLRRLSFHSFLDLKTWVVEEGAMPNLRILEMEDFPVLEMIPDGLRFITTLAEMSFHRMPEKFIRRIRTGSDGGDSGGGGGEDFLKICHVPSVILKNPSLENNICNG